MTPSELNREPKVCIVVLNWNGLDDTLACLESLQKMDYENYQAVVIDNGSAAGQADKIKKAYPGVKLIRNTENLGFTGGCNQGMDEALKMSADYTLLLNNDTIVTPGFLSKIVKFYEDSPDAGMVSPLILYTDRKRIWFAGARVWMGIIRHNHKGAQHSETALPDKPYKTAYVPGTAMLVSTGLIKRIGKLDDRYFAYYEDLDWCQKAGRLGLCPYVVPDAVIYHKKSGSTSEGGHRRWSKVPSYYIARNGFLLASDYGPFRKFIYVLAQLFVKLPSTMGLLVSPKAWGSYLRGTLAGLGMLYGPGKAGKAKKVHPWKTGLSIGISLLLIVYIYANRHFIFGAFAHIKPVYLIPVFIGQIGIQVSNASLLKATLKPLDETLGYIETFKLTVVSSFVNFFTPIVGGASLKAVYLKKRRNISYASFASVMYANYLMFFISSFLLGLIAVVLTQGALETHVGQLVALFFAGGAGASLIFMLFGHRITRLLSRREFKNDLVNKFSDKLAIFDDGWDLIRRDKKTIVYMAFWATMATLSVSLAYWGEMRCLNIAPTVATVIIFSALAIVGLLFNVTPGSIGIREAVYAAIFTVTGITGQQVVAFALIDRPTQLLVIGLGWIFFSRSLLKAE